MRAAAVVLALVVLTAGCASLPTEAPVDDEVRSGGDASTATTPTVDPDNPWGERTLSVAVSAPDADDRPYAPLVRTALTYWSENAERYAGYHVSFEVVDAAADADLVVAFVPRVENCDDVEEAAGCAPQPTSGAGIERPETVEVRTGLSNDSTVRVLKHEFGHALGLGHEDEPQPLMAPVAQLNTLPQPDATERALPWRDPELSVYVEFGNASDPERAREQVGHALDYFARGAGGTVPENVSFTLTRNRSAADVVVRFRESACGDDTGSCARRAGQDPDGDGALEFYTRLEVTLAGIDAPAVGWHVAYWLGYGFGFTEDADWPAPLRDASYEERRGEWWTEE